MSQAPVWALGLEQKLHRGLGGLDAEAGTVGVNRAGEAARWGTGSPACCLPAVEAEGLAGPWVRQHGPGW